MASTKDIIEINISRETRGVSRQGFGTPFFLGLHANFPERVRSYTSIDGVAEDFNTESLEYEAAQRFFGQQLEPTIIKIGRQKVDTIDFAIDVANNATYTLTIDGTEVTFVSDADATAEEISAGLAAEHTSAGATGTLVDNTGSLTFTPADTDSPDVQFTSNLNATFNTTESITDAITANRTADSDWYFLTAYTHANQDIQDLAAYAETQTVIYGTSYNGTDALDAQDETDPGSVLQGLNYSRTFIIYAEDPSQYPECAIIGLQAPKDPGSTTWKFKTVTGVTASDLTTTQSLTLKGSKFDYGKGYNTIEPTGGRDIFAEGRVVNSEFIDIVRFSDFIEARMREEIYLTLVNSEKVPYTDAGFALIEGKMRQVLNQGIDVGGLVDFNIIVPNPRALPTNSRINRVAEDFEFTATLAGATHFVEIVGRLQV